MNDNNIDPTKIREFIIETFLFGDSSGLDDDTSFMETGLIDSMGILRVAQFIEKTYGITLKQNQFVPDNLDSINNIVRFLGRNLEPQTVNTTPSAG